jgi:hypothetical protein
MSKKSDNREFVKATRAIDRMRDLAWRAIGGNTDDEFYGLDEITIRLERGDLMSSQEIVLEIDATRRTVWPDCTPEFLAKEFAEPLLKLGISRIEMLRLDTVYVIKQPRQKKEKT